MLKPSAPCQRLLHLCRKLHEDELVAMTKVVFAALVNHSQQVILGRFSVRKDLVDLPPNQGCLVIGIINTHSELSLGSIHVNSWTLTPMLRSRAGTHDLRRGTSTAKSRVCGLRNVCRRHYKRAASDSPNPAIGPRRKTSDFGPSRASGSSDELGRARVWRQWPQGSLLRRRDGDVEGLHFSEGGQGFVEIVRAAHDENLELVWAQMRLSYA